MCYKVPSDKSDGTFFVMWWMEFVNVIIILYNVAIRLSLDIICVTNKKLLAEKRHAHKFVANEKN